MKVLKLFSIFMLCTQLSFALQDDAFSNRDDVIEMRAGCRPKCHSKSKNQCSQSCNLGSAGFVALDPSQTYVVNTLNFPSVVPLSLNRNIGFTQGNIALTPTGLLINEPGNYSVDFSSIIFSTDFENSGLLISAYLVLNSVFNPIDATIPIAVVPLPDGTATLQGNAILQNVPAGTTVSIVVANGGGLVAPEPISIVRWTINLFKIPCTTDGTL